jgi:hypothetical protein
MKSFQFYIGIDPGVMTGVCVWDRHIQQIIQLDSMKIHQAMKLIGEYKRNRENNFFVRVEDARKRFWFSNSGSEKWQGAGSIKRDCKIWEDYLTDLHIDFELIAPRSNLTRLTHIAFGNITGYHKPSNEHERAAAMLVYGISK